MIYIKYKSLHKYKAFYKQCSEFQSLLLVADCPKVPYLEEQIFFSSSWDMLHCLKGLCPYVFHESHFSCFLL